MARRWALALALGCLGGLWWVGNAGLSSAEGQLDTEGDPSAMARIRLPQPRLKGQMSVEEAIQGRRSRRDYTDEPLTMEQLAQLLWAAQGITSPREHKRAAPSAGATFPMEIFVAVGPKTVGELPAGVYRYVPTEHALEKTADGDIRAEVAAAALGQEFMEVAPVDILMAAEYARTGNRYGERARRYVAMEAGHISQNIYLQAEALGLGTVAVGAFRDQAVAAAFKLPPRLEPVYMMPVGHRAQS